MLNLKLIINLLKLKVMDIQTVISITKLIDARIDIEKHNYSYLELFMISHHEPTFLIDKEKEKHELKIKTLQDLNDHLQVFIEGKLNAAENSTEQ